jgi:hypothetical protein
MCFCSCTRNENKKTSIAINKAENNESEAYAKINYAQNLYEAVHIGDINYIQRYIHTFNNSSVEQDLFSNNNDLRLLRNTIYAMRGYIFRSRDLQEHFNKFSWYNGIKDNIENELNENEKKLIRVISAMEQVNPPSPNDIIGFWTIPVPASVEYIGFMDLQINSDGTIGGFLNGLWSLEGSVFNTRRVNSDEIWLPPGLGQLGTVENLRIIVFELDGKLYQTIDFFGAYPNDNGTNRHWYRRNDIFSLVEAWGWREDMYRFSFN